MRKLFMAIFIPILVLLGTPAMLAVIMYDAAGYDEMPTELYTVDADAQAMLYQELSDSLDELNSGLNDDLEFNLHEDIINVAIFEALREQNPNYMPGEDCATADECYFMHTPLPIEEGSELRIVGAWVEFEQDTFIMNVFIDVQITADIAYMTVVETHFKLEDHPGAGKYTLQFDKIRLGNLPIPSAMISSILGIVEDNFADLNLDGVLGDLPLGEFDIDTFTYTVLKDEIVAKIGETEDGVEPSDETLMVQEIASIIFEQGLFDFELVDEELVLAARVSKFESEDVTDIPAYLYDLHEITGYDEFGQPIYGDFDPTAFDPTNTMQNVFEEFIFNNALFGGGFQLKERLFNKMIYYGASGFEEAMQVETLELPDGSTREVRIGLRAVWFTIEEDAIYANALFQLDSIPSLMRLKATKIDEVSTDLDLVFEFTELNFGEDSDETAADYIAVNNLDVFESFLLGVESIEFGSIEESAEGNVQLRISGSALNDVLTEGVQSSAQTVVVTSLELQEGAFVINIEAADPAIQAALDNLSTAFNDVLKDETLLTNLSGALNPNGDNQEAQDVIDAMTAIQNDLTSGTTELDPDDVTALFEEVEDLSPEEQEQFMTEIGDLLPEGILDDFDQYFGEGTIPSTTP